VREAAAQDEQAEQPKQGRKGHVPSAAHEPDQDHRDGQVSEPNGQIGKVVELDQLLTPTPSGRARIKFLRVQELAEKVQHGVTLVVERFTSLLLTARFVYLDGGAVLCFFAGTSG
jgi:hypothetical protein